MKICFAGLGSIGARHLKNLVRLATERKLVLTVHAYRHSDDELLAELTSLVDKQIFKISDLDTDYDIGFITNPTSAHFDSIKLLGKHCRNLFIEKPLFDVLDKTPDELGLNANQICYVAAPLLYTDVFNQVKNDILGKRVYSARVICSSYLPDWQKGRDYRKSFRASLEQGGGVDIDLIHEIDYVSKLFGAPIRICRVAKHVSDLEIETCDLASYIYEYEDKVVEIHLDYFGRSDKRIIEIYLENEVIEGDFLKKEVRYLRGAETKSFDLSVDHYYREMCYFIDLVQGIETRNKNPIDRAYQTLCFSKGEVHE